MRTPLENIERAEQYLNNEMTAPERQVFETELTTDVSLRDTLARVKALHSAVIRKELRGRIESHAGGSKGWGKNGLNWGLGGFAILVVAAAAWFFTTQLPSETSENLRYGTNELGTKEFVDADRFLPSQVFDVDGGKDTVIQTKGGITMTILANTFLDEDGHPVQGKVELEVKEALDPLSIMKAGLTTMSGDQLLESGGMFYVNGRQGSKSLQINPNQGIYTQVPTKSKEAKMQLFDGKRMADGRIDWVSPKPLETFLTPMEITTLNFYPPDYLNELENRGHDRSDKRFTDSLYYSYADKFGSSSVQPEIVVVENDIWFETDKLDGELLYKRNCASCHRTDDKNLIGPGLAGIENRAPSKEWLVKYVQNPSAMVATGDPYANSIKDYSPSVMTNFGFLSEEEILAIFDYVDTPVLNWPEAVVNGINPASIKTIWNEKFNNTNLATKEFEERLSHVHNSCDQWILDYYVNNLDKRLSTLDSAVALRRSGRIAKEGSFGDSLVLYPSVTVPEDKFWEFARRGDGRVQTDNKYAEFLKSYYHRQAKMEAEAIHLVRKKYDAENMRKLQEAQGKQNEHLTKEAERISENWQQEFKTNLKEAYRQLGYPEPVVPRGRATNNAIVTTPGWKNVDQYVAESVAKRETLDYTDKDGNRAVIKYEAITLQIANAAEFDRVLVYMLPDNLYSFQRMNQTSNAYSEKLNELFEYDVMCIGFKGDESFIHHIRSAEAKDHGTVTLSHIASTELEKLLYTVKDYSVQSNLKEDLAYQRFNVNEQKRVEKRMVKEQLRNEMFSVVFPCDSRKLSAYTTFE